MEAESTVLVTGGARGMGAAQSMALAAAGHHVVVCDLLDADGAVLVEQIRSSGGSASYHHLDVSDSAAWEALITQVMTQRGGIARQFAHEGAAVVINDLGTSTDGVGADASPAEELAASIRAEGGSAVADNGDITEIETGQRLVDTAVKEFGGLHIVVNVAGILRDRMIFNMEEGEWDAVIKTHLRGHFSTCRPASAYWRDQKNPEGNYRIINFTSFSALHGSPGQANYAAAKLGVVGMTYSLARGLARYGVTANAVAPGAMTRLSGTLLEDKRPNERGMARDDDRLSPDNVAPIVTYLASERSGWLTGRTLSAMGYEVGLYNNPEIIRSVSTTGPWELDQLATVIEHSFKPVANGLPASMFASQVKN